MSIAQTMPPMVELVLCAKSVRFKTMLHAGQYLVTAGDRPFWRSKSKETLGFGGCGNLDRNGYNAYESTPRAFRRGIISQTECRIRNRDLRRMACVMHLRRLGRDSNGVNPMTRRWDGYLVRALNDLVSLTRACRPSDLNTVRAKVLTSPAYSEQRRKRKSSGRRKRRNTTGV
jgi:hypothetical protein